MKYLLLLYSLFLLFNLVHAQQDSSFVDPRDQQNYKTILIGNQIWMAENLRYNSPDSYLNPNNPSEKYGRLYTWQEATNVCPEGWHLPSSVEWWNLIDFANNFKAPNTITVGRDSDGKEGDFLKSRVGWTDNGARYPQNNGTNRLGFNLLPAGRGYKYMGGTFRELGESAACWVLEENERKSSEAKTISFNCYSHEVDSSGRPKTTLQSVRCIKNR